MDPREELEALRRLAELEDKAAGKPPTQTVKNALPKLGEAWNDVSRGAISLPASVMDMLPPMQLLKMLALQAKGVPPMTALEAGQQGTLGHSARGLIPTPDPRTEPDFRKNWVRPVLEGTGAGTVGAGRALARAPLTTLSTVFAGNVGGVAGAHGARNVVGSAGATDPSFLQAAEGVGSLLGGFAGQLPVNFVMSRASGLQAPLWQRDLKRAAPPLDDPAWQMAEQNANSFAGLGLNTTTVPDLFPGKNGLTALAEEVRGNKGGELLRNRVAGRGEDLAALTDLARGPDVAPAEVAARAAKTSDRALDNLRGFRTTSYGGQFQQNPLGAWMDPNTASEAQLALARNLASDPSRGQSRLYRDAFEQLAEAAVHPDPAIIPQPPQASVQVTPKTTSTGATIKHRTTVLTPQPPLQVPVGKSDVLAASGELKQVQRNTNPLTATGGKLIDAHATGEGYGLVNDVLKDANPNYGRAEKAYQAISDALVNPATRGPLGIMSGRAFSENAPVPTARLAGMYEGQSPQMVERTQLGLNRLDPGIGQQIAAAIIRQKLAKGAMDVGNTLRGQPGSPAEQNLVAMVRGGGGDANELQRVMHASDQHQRYLGEPGHPSPDVSVWSRLIRPFRAFDLALSGMGVEGARQRIAEILASGDQQGLAQLRAAAMFDPSIRRELSLAASVSPALEQKER